MFRTNPKNYAANSWYHSTHACLSGSSSCSSPSKFCKICTDPCLYWCYNTNLLSNSVLKFSNNFKRCPYRKKFIYWLQKYLGIYGKFISSAMSGVLAKAITYPLDTVRKRLQVQGFEAGRLGMGETPKYSSMSDCFGKIFRTEGYQGFFKGIVPGSLKAALSTMLYFQLYEVFKQKISEMRHE